MAEGYFTEAGSLMREGGLDPREVYAAHFPDHYAICISICISNLGF